MEFQLCCQLFLEQEEYKKKLQELVVKDEELVRDVIKKIKMEKGLE